MLTSVLRFCLGVWRGREEMALGVGNIERNRKNLSHLFEIVFF